MKINIEKDFSEESKFINLDNILDDILKVLGKTYTYKAYCCECSSECDKSLVDIDHYLLFNKLSAVDISKVNKIRQNILKYRQFYKDEIRKIDSVMLSDSTIAELKKIKTSYREATNSLNNRQYTPRILFNLFPDKEEKKKDRQAVDQVEILLGKKSNKSIKLQKKLMAIEK